MPAVSSQIKRFNSGAYEDIAAKADSAPTIPKRGKV